MLSHPFFRRFNWVYFTLSVFLAVVFTYLGLHITAGMPVMPALFDALISILLLAVILIYVVNTLGFYHPVKYVFLILFTTSLIITILYSVIMELVLPFVYEESDLNLLIQRYFWPRFIYSWFIICGTAVISWFYYRIKEMEKRLARQEEADRVAKEAELYKLRQQLQPHFLFNSLNSINALIGSQPELARKMVFQLSDFFRGTLKREEKKFIPLKEELDYIRLYLEIEQVRFGHRLQAEILCEPELGNIPVPPLVLQPIMENAIKFGLYGTTGDVCISVKVHDDAQFLYVDISNPYDATSSQVKGTGFGLEAVKRRLYLLFARNDLMKTSQDAEVFYAHLKFPKTV